MAAVARPPPPLRPFQPQFGGPFPPFNPQAHWRQNDFPQPLANRAPFNQYQPRPAVDPRFPDDDADAPFDQYTQAEYQSRSRADRADHTRPRQRNNRVAFRTPNGGYYSTSATPIAERVRQNEESGPSRGVWSRLLSRRRRGEPTNTNYNSVGTSTPFDSPMPRFQSTASGRRSQVEQVISLLAPHVPAAEPVIRSVANHVHDHRLLQQLIDALSRPLTEQQLEEIRTTFTIPQDEQEEIIWTLNRPGDPAIPRLMDQFREFVGKISGIPPPYNPVAGPGEVSASRRGTFSRLGRLVPSILRRSLRSRRRQRSQSTIPHTIPAPEFPQPMTEQQSPIREPRSSESRRIPIHEPPRSETGGIPNQEPRRSESRQIPIRELQNSEFRRLIVEPFTCTGCETNIPANRTRGADPQLGANLHIRCPNTACSWVFCRGCHRNVIGCQPNCNARHACAIKSCCADVRAIAIFEYLSVFDEDYLTRVRNFHRGADDAHTHANRLLFLADAFDPANRRDPRFRGFISVLKRTLKYVHFWLEPSVPENAVCSVVSQMLAVSFLLEAVQAFLSRGIETLAEFRVRGYLIHRVVALLFTLGRHRGGPLYDLMGSSLAVIGRSPGLRRLIWVPGTVVEGGFHTGEDPAILQCMQDLWRSLEREIGSEALERASNEFDARLYERGYNLSLLQSA